ncbi:pilus assembly FimT family protein [Fontivita pretiosa]|uniref:pilus assembly FimT family protein n=1 Tax=Fontivita pretiosa TaxID=2989684 RepID=UPI003D1728F7
MRRGGGQTRSARLGGFTLLELVLVLVIIATVMAMAAPSLRGFSRGARQRDTAEELLAMTRWARTYATTQGVVCRLNIDTAAGRFWLSEQQPGSGQFTQIGSSFGRVYTAPAGVQIEVLPPRDALLPGRQDAAAMQQTQRIVTAGSTVAIDFYPTGRTRPVRIRLTDEGRYPIEIECASPAELFHIVNPGEAS